MAVAMSERFAGRSVIVTASASGMGRASAERFAREGAHVYVADLDSEGAGETAAGIVAVGGSAVAVGLDVTDLDGWATLLDRIRDEHGRLNVLYNHAGIPGPPGLDLADEEFDTVIDINLKSAFMATKLAVPLLEQAAGHACVLYTSSTSGLVGAPSSPVYGLTKGGVVSLARSAAKLLGPRGIRCNVICPGTIATPMLYEFATRGVPRESVSRSEVDERMQHMVDTQIPMRRLGTPDDVAAAAAFLASDDASFITGVALPVDGGWLA